MRAVSLKREMKTFFIKYAPLFIFLISLALVTIELFTFSGFVRKHFVFSLNYYLFFSFLLFLTIPIEKSQKYFRKVGAFLFATSLVVFFMMVALASVELVKYPNYIFSKIHLELKNLPLLVGYLLTLSFISLYLQKLSKTFKNSDIFYLFFSFLLVIFVFNNSVQVAGNIRRFLPPVFAYPMATYSDKMFYLWGDPLRFLEDTAKLIPDNSRVFIPPKDVAHAVTGNLGFDRYFLYPREILSFDPGKSSGGYLISSPGNELGNGVFSRWPDFNVDSNYYWFIDANKNVTKKVFDSYKFRMLKGKDWALIKI